MLYLNVPFHEKDQAKSLYAKWDPAHKKWYADNSKYYYKFAKWITGNIVLLDHFFIIESSQECWKCNKTSKVVTFGYGPHLIIEGPFDDKYDVNFMNDGIYISGELDSFPKTALEHIQRNFPVKERYSKTRKYSYMSNGCEHCDALFGLWNLYEEPDSPFFIQDSNKLNNMIVYKVPLKYDIAIVLTTIPLTTTFKESDVKPIMLNVLNETDYFE